MSADDQSALPTEGGVPSSPVRVIAFYLPQFYPTAYNDEWWGPGFTEWTNVAGARRWYPGHYQPRIPGELGFYDLRLAETRNAQADLARAHGVHAFCYWHYWFGDGVRVLERPFREVLESGSPDFPFCLAWANQSWSGIWHGAPDRILVEQRYPGDEQRHFESLEAAFHDDRYVRVDGKPLLFVLLPMEIPDVRFFVDRWQELARSSGLPGLFLVGRSRAEWSSTQVGFDACVIAPTVPPIRNRLAQDKKARFSFDWRLNAFARRTQLFPTIYSYREWAKYIPRVPNDDEMGFPVVVPGWDNTPRAGRRGSIYHGSTPELFEQQVARAANLVTGRSAEHRIIFLQAWNEWAEGNYLEPDRKFGRRFLQALQSGLGAASASS